MARPYMKLRIDELTAIADDPATSSETRARLIDELQYRSSPGARKLLARMRPGGQPGAREGRRPAPRDPATGGLEVPIERGPDEREPEQVDRDALLAALRETYTMAAEILARWGMTSAIDGDLFEVVVRWWSGRVSEEPDEFGRSKSSLVDDVSRLHSLGHFGGGDGTGVD